MKIRKGDVFSVYGLLLIADETIATRPMRDDAPVWVWVVQPNNAEPYRVVFCLSAHDVIDNVGGEW